MPLKGLYDSVISLATLECNYWNLAMQFGINCTPTIGTNISQTNIIKLEQVYSRILHWSDMLKLTLL